MGTLESTLVVVIIFVVGGGDTDDELENVEEMVVVGDEAVSGALQLSVRVSIKARGRPHET